VTTEPTGLDDRSMRELDEFLRIRSISSDGKHPQELRQAAEWVRSLLGDGATISEDHGNPVVDGLIPASGGTDAPTVVAYGHYDVQSPGPESLWESPAFEPEVRDGWLYARGASDDKGNFYTLLRAALDLAAAGELGVNVRVIADGEEEVGGHSVIDYLAGVSDRFAAAVIFDGGMASADVPAITNALRGLVGFQLRLVTNAKELHSGLYGGVVANPVNDLIAVLGAVIGKEDELAAGCAPVTESERAGWDILPAGEALLRDAGGTPADDRAADEFYERTWARPSLTVHSIGAGDPLLHKTSVASEARASLSLRLAPGQDPDALFDELERRLRAALPSHAQLELDRWPPGQPAYMSPDDPVMHAAQRAIEQATGVAPVTMRSGGTIPIMAALIARGTPTILSGFGTSEDNIHSPNERIRLRNLAWGLASAREIYRELAGTLG
jgi:acetylornithine deacetylase/succinyl-diaminopimelate desuccinylase-like protein